MNIKTQFATGTIPCHLFWDDQTQCVVRLPAIPQIDSFLILDNGEDKEMASYRVVGVSMTAKPMPLEEYVLLDNPPVWACFVKVFLEKGAGVEEDPAFPD